MAHQEEESQPRDVEVGPIQHSSKAACDCVCQGRRHGLTVTQRTVKFINDDATSVHGNLRAASVYTSESGEWKLGGFEVLSSVKDDEAIIYVSGETRQARTP